MINFMIELDDRSPFRIFESQIDSQKSGNQRQKLSHYMPAGFAGYCKVHHSIYIDLDLENENHDWSKAAWQSEESQRLHKRSLWPLPNFRAQRVLWRDLATQQQIEHSKRLYISSFPSWSLEYVIEDDKFLDYETATRLSKAFLQSQVTADYYFGYWSYEQDQNGNYTRLYKANLIDDDGLLNLENQTAMNGPTAYWWAIDQSWCMAAIQTSEVNFSFVGASRAVIDLILKDTFLEVVEIEYQEAL